MENALCLKIIAKILQEIPLYKTKGKCKRSEKTDLCSVHNILHSAFQRIAKCQLSGLVSIFCKDQYLEKKIKEKDVLLVNEEIA